MREFTSDAEEVEDGDRLKLPEVIFTLDGEKFQCVSEMDGDALLEWSELGRAATEDTAADSPEGAAFLATFLRASFGAAEYRRFRAHVRKHKTPPSVILKVVAGITEEIGSAVEGATGRPTAPQSPSSPGAEVPDGRTARIMSLSGGEVRFVDPPPAKDHLDKGGKARKAATGG